MVLGGRIKTRLQPTSGYTFSRMLLWLSSRKCVKIEDPGIHLVKGAMGSDPWSQQSHFLLCCWLRIGSPKCHIVTASRAWDYDPRLSLQWVSRKPVSWSPLPPSEHIEVKGSSDPPRLGTLIGWLRLPASTHQSPRLWYISDAETPNQLLLPASGPQQTQCLWCVPRAENSSWLQLRALWAHWSPWLWGIPTSGSGSRLIGAPSLRSTWELLTLMCSPGWKPRSADA